MQRPESSVTCFKPPRLEKGHHPILLLWNSNRFNILCSLGSWRWEMLRQIKATKTMQTCWHLAALLDLKIPCSPRILTRTDIKTKEVGNPASSLGGITYIPNHLCVFTSSTLYTWHEHICIESKCLFIKYATKEPLKTWDQEEGYKDKFSIKILIRTRIYSKETWGEIQ